MAKQIEKLLYSVDSAAEAIDGSPSTVNRLIAENQLEVIRLRGDNKAKGMRVTASSLQAWIQRRRLAGNEGMEA